MGPNDDDVVDASLRVRGLTGLRIADASVLPVQVSGNTAAPAMLVGYRAADLVLADLLAAEREVDDPCGPAILVWAASTDWAGDNPCDSREHALTCGDSISVR